MHPSLLLNQVRQKLSEKVAQKFSDRFIRNTGWLSTAELANRVFRLGTTVTLARAFSPQDYGLVALVMTVNEFATVFICKAGITSKLVQAAEEDVDTLSETAYWLSWMTSITILGLQCLASFFVAWFYQDQRLIPLICVIALPHLLVPLFAVQAAMLERANRLHVFALCNVTQSFIANVLTIALALLHWGVWSVVVAFVCSAPAWIIITRRNYAWSPQSSFTLHRWPEIARFAVNILGGDLLAKLRDNIDYLLVGYFLGLEALGIYYFAFNAGLGISLSVINSLTWSLWPHLCAARAQLSELKRRYFGGLRTISMVIIPTVLLQSSLAPLYVPVIFGHEWIHAIPILIVICLSAIPRPFFLAASHLLNAIDQSHITLRWSLIFTVLYGLALLTAVNYGIFAVAIAVLTTQFLVTPVFVTWTTRFVFKAPA